MKVQHVTVYFKSKELDDEIFYLMDGYEMEFILDFDKRFVSITTRDIQGEAPDELCVFPLDSVRFVKAISISKEST